MARTAHTHTAIVYFHGIGEQRRHQEISRLIDALDRYAFLEEQSVGRLEKIQGAYEVSRIADRDDFAYVSVEHRRVKDGRHLTKRIRFYEGYWASLNRASYSLTQLFAWSARHILSPVRPIRSPWRSEPRLRRRALHQLADRGVAPPDPKTVRRLLDAYDDFERPDLRRTYPKGRFKDFVDSLSPDRADERTLAMEWRQAFVQGQLKSFGVLTTMFLSILVAALAFVFAVLQVLELVASLEVSSELGGDYKPSWSNAASLAGVFVVLVGGARLASQLLGDVVGWAAYRETDPRHEVREAILTQAVDTLSHVLLDPDTDRVVVIGHSLGTAIAYDALLTIGNRHRAAGEAGAQRVGDLSKLDQFITLGSPIDVLHNIAESHRGRYHRYVRLEEAFRGDIGSAPFSPVNAPRKPHMHWINIWDRFDPIASPLYSPNQKRAAAMPVDNVRCTSMAFPEPAGSHGSYFLNRDVLHTIFHTAVLEEHSYRCERRPQKVGRGAPARRASVAQLAMLAFPWIAAAGIVGRPLSTSVSNVAMSATVLLAIGITAGIVVARSVGVRPGVASHPATELPSDSTSLTD